MYESHGNNNSNNIKLSIRGCWLINMLHNNVWLISQVITEHGISPAAIADEEEKLSGWTGNCLCIIFKAKL